MPKQTHESGAQFVDRFLQRIALGGLMISLAYGMSALAHVVNESTAQLLDSSNLAFAALAIVLVLPPFVRFIRMRELWRENCSEPDGFVKLAFTKASEKSFSLTLVFLILLTPISKQYLIELPSTFFLELTLTLSLAAFSMTFFFLNRDVIENEDDFEQDDRQ